MRLVSRHVAAMSLAFVALTTLEPTTASAQQSATPSPCNQAMPDPIARVTVNGSGQMLVTRDGCWIFLSVTHESGVGGGVAVLRRTGGTIAQVHFHAIEKLRGINPSLAMTHDETMLVVKVDREVVFLDVNRLTVGRGDAVLGAMSDHHFSPIGAMDITADDRYLFVSQNTSGWISVIDLNRARNSGFGQSAIVGGIPTDGRNFTLALSPDDRFLYVNAQPMVGSPGSISDPALPCFGHRVPQEGFMVIDVQRAVSKPDVSSVIAPVRAGCGVPSLALSPDGDTIYVTSPQDNALSAFDTRPLRDGLVPRLINRVPVGPQPRYVVTIDDGKRIVVSNSNNDRGVQAEATASSYLTVIDAAKVASGAAAVLGTVPADASPYLMAVTNDGRTLLLSDASNYFAPGSRAPTILVIDLDRLTLGPVKP